MSKIFKILNIKTLLCSILTFITLISLCKLCSEARILNKRVQQNIILMFIICQIFEFIHSDLINPNFYIIFLYLLTVSAQMRASIRLNSKQKYIKSQKAFAILIINTRKRSKQQIFETQFD